MTKDEIRKCLEPILEVETDGLDIPTEAEWLCLESKLKTKFGTEFRSFIELMAEFSFPGDILNVSSDGNTNGNDDIALVYQDEIKNGRWNEDMIPFYSIGNGDYFCLSAKEGAQSPVFYYYHENGSFSQEYDGFAEWLNALPDFLS